MSHLSLPPLFHGQPTDGADPFAAACRQARAGCDAGLMTYDLRPDILRAAVVFAPDVPLREAAIMLPLCGIGFQNALGALAPPEVSVHLDWAGPLRINGAVAGRLCMAAAPRDPAQTPDWLVVSLTLALWPAAEETGLTPDVTALFSEGCADVQAPDLLEAWVRHTLVWINRWSDEGPRPIHSEWSGLAHGLKETTEVAGRKGTFTGIDENLGMILQSDSGTTIIPLTDLLTTDLQREAP
ncbi:biotin/lipoate--protein ligase family protein [Roseobacter weihaiensis]|uniref:biotin/lipoate--protein ligase family protein n=1 Tax=Roseobacter weihaiensis TaxID=2763262 RepID=UPI001D0A10B2|nr:biotin/lipoate--protein ligase family protein [Roseobacter sp. H9]